MTYHVEQAIENFGGKEKLLQYLELNGTNQIELHKLLKLSDSSNRINNSVYKRIYSYLGINELPYPRLSIEDKTLQLHLDKYMPNYWKDEYLVNELFNRLSNPTLNIFEDRVRLVISFPRHPRAHITSNQIKAHIVAWELYHYQYVPDNHWVIPLDNDYLNLDESNLVLVNTTEYKSKRFSGKGNPSYIHGERQRPKLGGWFKISQNKIKHDKKCSLCNNTDDLLVHHIINYRLFNNPIEAHQELNLITLCRSCHGKIHGYTSSIKEVLISEMRYSKLIELLETLKSQVPDSLMETYRAVEKQLGLTDNQQLSTV